MNIKLSTLRSVLHESDDFDARNRRFIESIEKELGASLQLADIGDYDCDLKLIFIESGGSEGFFLEQFDKLQEPYYFITSGENNSLAATLEIMTYLNKHNKVGEIIHGSISYMVKRINELARVEAATEVLKNARLGVVGAPSDWLIASIPDYAKVKETLGIELIDVPLQMVVDKFNTVDLANYNEPELLEFDTKELDAAKKVYLALNEIKDEYKLDGLTLRCFDLLDTLHTTGCLGLAFLNKKGIMGTCEGDVMAMVTMMVVRALTGQSSFQANPSKIVVDSNQITLAHCTIPFDMLTDYHLKTHFESGIGVAVKGELKTEDVTVFRMSSDLKRYFVSEGKIVTNLNEPNLCRTQIVVELDEPVDTLLTNPCGNHHIIFYGRHKALVDQLLKNLL